MSQPSGFTNTGGSYSAGPRSPHMTASTSSAAASTAAPRRSAPKQIDYTSMRFISAVLSFVALIQFAVYVFTIALLHWNSLTSVITYRSFWLLMCIIYSISSYRSFKINYLRKANRPSLTPSQIVVAVLTAEDFQYTIMNFFWLYSLQNPFATFPIAIYSTFHLLSYVRASIIGTLYGDNPEKWPAAVRAWSLPIFNLFSQERIPAHIRTAARFELLTGIFVLLQAFTFRPSRLLFLGLYTAFLLCRSIVAASVVVVYSNAAEKVEGLIITWSPGLLPTWKAVSGQVLAARAKLLALKQQRDRELAAEKAARAKGN